MQCPDCQREAVEGAAFCNHCGTQLQIICISCNTFNPLDSKFCSRCGSNLSPGSQGVELSAYEEPQVSSPIHSTACPRCHKVNEPGSAYCYSCGLPLDEAEKQVLISSAQSNPSGIANSAPTSQSRPDATDRQAGFWIRFAAIIVDGIVIFGLMVVAVILVSEVIMATLGEDSYDFCMEGTYQIDDWNWAEGLDYASWAVVFTGYFSIPVVIWATTIGKRVFGLYVVRADGSKVGIGRALARWLCYFLSLLILGIGFLMIAFRRDKRGLHDLICDTMVVRR